MFIINIRKTNIKFTRNAILIYVLSTRNNYFVLSFSFPLKKCLKFSPMVFWWLSYNVSLFLKTENQLHEMMINETGFLMLISSLSVYSKPL